MQAQRSLAARFYSINGLSDISALLVRRVRRPPKAAGRQNKKPSSSKKEYLISLYHTRSLIALAAGVLVLCLAAAAVTEKLLIYAYAEENRLHFFTVQSNILAAVGTAFLIPYAIQGFRGDRVILILTGLTTDIRTVCV